MHKNDFSWGFAPNPTEQAFGWFSKRAALPQEGTEEETGYWHIGEVI